MFVYFATLALLSCPDGWINNNNGSCYKVLSDELRTFPDAQNACKDASTSSYVAVANNDKENAFLDSLTADRIWLGCNARGTVPYLWICPDGSGNTYDAVANEAKPWGSYWSKLTLKLFSYEHNTFLTLARRFLFVLLSCPFPRMYSPCLVFYPLSVSVLIFFMYCHITCFMSRLVMYCLVAYIFFFSYTFLIVLFTYM